jgi:hypothetical protein
VRRLGVREFWLTHIEPPPREEEKRIAGDFSDIEQALLALPPDDRPRQVRAGAPPGASASGDAAASKRPLSAEETRRQELQRKRDRGRLRQQRLLKRRKDR